MSRERVDKNSNTTYHYCSEVGEEEDYQQQRMVDVVAGVLVLPNKCCVGRKITQETQHAALRRGRSSILSINFLLMILSSWWSLLSCIGCPIERGRE